MTRVTNEKDDEYYYWGQSELIERIHDLEARVEGDLSSAQHPFRQSAVIIVDEIIEPTIRPLEGDERERVEDNIVGVLERTINK